MAVPQSGAEIRADALSLGRVVFQRLSASILDGTLAPGEILRVEDLQRWLGVSRTPIREALGRLSSLGIIETQPGRFTRVARVTPRTEEDTMVYIGFHGGLAFRLAAERMTDGHIDAALDLVDQMASASDANHVQTHLEASRRLVDLAVDIADNNILRHVAGELNLIGEWNLRHQSTLRGTRMQRRENHTRLRDAIRNRDPDYAEFAFRALYHSHEETGHGVIPVDRSP